MKRGSISKKAAIEMSITTIIVIVIGITLLTLGLFFVRSIFSQVQDISDTTFSKAKSLIGNLENVESVLTISPNQINIEQGKDDVVKVIVANLESTVPISPTITVSSGDNNIDCKLYTETGATTNTITLSNIASGKQKQLSLIAKDKSGPLRTVGCGVKATINSDEKTETLVVRVKEKSGIF